MSLFVMIMFIFIVMGAFSGSSLVTLFFMLAGIMIILCILNAKLKQTNQQFSLQIKILTERLHKMEAVVCPPDNEAETNVMETPLVSEKKQSIQDEIDVPVVQQAAAMLTKGDCIKFCVNPN